MLQSVGGPGPIREARSPEQRTAHQARPHGAHLDIHAVAGPPVLVAGAAVQVFPQPQHLAPAPPALLVLPLQAVQGPALPALLQPAEAVARRRGLRPGQQPVVLQQLLWAGGAGVRDTGQAESGAPVWGLPLASPSVSEDVGCHVRARHRERGPRLSLLSPGLQANKSRSELWKAREAENGLNISGP